MTRPFKGSRLWVQEKEKGVKGKELEHSVRARNEMTKRLNKRRTAESSLHSIALQMNGRALSRLHDAGMEPCSKHESLTPSWHRMGCFALAHVSHHDTSQPRSSC